MTAAHISTLYFSNHAEMAKKRLQKLSANRFIKRREDPRFRMAPFVLARRGFDELRSRGILLEYPSLSRGALERRARVSTLTLAHELEVMDVKAAFARNAAPSEIDVLEFTTWPHLIEFSVPGRVTAELVKPDGFIRTVERCSNSARAEHAFFIEVDRSTETLSTLVDRANAYVAFYRSGGFAVRHGARREDFYRHLFRILYVFKTEERRNNAAERLLNQMQPILTQVWLTTSDEITNNPFGPIWITPEGYRDALRGSTFEIRRDKWGRSYSRRNSRDAIVAINAIKQPILG